MQAIFSHVKLFLQGGLPNTAATQTFAQSLLDRLPRSSGQAEGKTYAQKEHEKAALARRNRGYSLLEASDEEDDTITTAIVPTTQAVPAKAKQLRKSKVISYIGTEAQH